MADITALDNKCPACNAKVVWNPTEQKFKCEYCASQFTLEQMQQYNTAASLENNKVDENFAKITSKDGLDVYRCKNCGAEIIADQNTTATFCVYCGSTAILKEKIDSGIAPNYIIPFKNEKESTYDAFTKLFKGRPLTPNAFKDVNNIKKISGVYIPFWAYDIKSNGNITFHCEDVRSWNTYDYHYIETTTYSTTVDCDLDFNKVLADGSSRFPDDLMDSLEPFDYGHLVDYNHAYLSGFLAEKYDVNNDVAFTRASQRVMNTSISKARSACRHGTAVVSKNDLSIDNKKTYYILLPVWMVSIKYKNKDYIFAMNGDTGKIVGDIPISVGKTILWIFIFLIVFFLIGFLFARFVI